MASAQVEEENIVRTDKTTALGRTVDWYYSKKAEEEAAAEQEEELKPLTADEIEQIRQAAYDEGLLQGHNEGFEKGHAEGLEKGHAEGVEQGKEQGIEAGFAEGRELVESNANQWATLAQQLNTPLSEFNAQAEQQLVELTVMLAEAVVGVEVKTNPTVIRQALLESVKALPINDTQCEISLNPIDLDLIKSEYSDAMLEENGWHLKAEPAIAQGGCIVESRTSSIDRTLQERVKNTLERFLQDTGINSDEG